MVRSGSRFTGVTAIVIGAALLLSAGVAHSQSQPQVAADVASATELQPVRVRGLDKVEAIPGADLSPYRKIMLDPIEVSFSKNWREGAVTGSRIRSSDKVAIREGLAKVLREEFVRVLTRDGRYEIADSPGDDVLRIRAEIKDLYINAPDVLSAPNVRSYTLSVGEMTLMAELRDSVTGDLIARVTDRKRDPESSYLELTTRVDNVAAARRAAASWARILRGQLDSAHAALEAAASTTDSPQRR
ncbi:MAG: DUF3313 family protein [Pseudomonadales bacterium]|nr:DUF3313 family protein [Pseudomonadales bacterium]